MPPTRRARVYDGLRSRPWATALALLVFLGGIYGVLGIGLQADVLAEFVPKYALKMISALYALSGLALIVGMGWHKGNIEAFGCLGIFGGILARAVATFAAFGMTVASFATLVVYIAIAASAIERYRQIQRDEQIVMVTKAATVEIRPE